MVIGITIGATLLLTRGTGDATTTPSGTQNDSDFASANDNGPIELINAEPTCKAFGGITKALSDVEAQGWSARRDSLGSSSTWTAEDRSKVQTVATALSNASDQMIGLANATPNRVVRELYLQFIAYARSYVAAINNYVPADNNLADAHVDFGNTIQGICTAIDTGASSRSISLDRADPPTSTGGSANPSQTSTPFLSGNIPACKQWSVNNDVFNAGTDAWAKLDPAIPGDQWTPEQRTVQLNALPVFTEFANQMENTGRASGNSVFEDFAVLGARYLKAYASTGANYGTPDSWLSYVALRLNNAVAASCRAVSE